MDLEGNDTVRTSATHPALRARSLTAVAVCTALSLAQAQALAQGPPGGRPPSLQPPPTQPQPPSTTPSPDAALPEPAPPAGQPGPAPVTPEPLIGPGPASALAPQLTPRERARAEKLRLAGIGTMAGGGVLSAFSFGLTLAFTIQGRNRHDELATVEDDRQRQDCSRMTSMSCTQLTRRIDDLTDQLASANRSAQISGAIMLSGFLVVAVGGVLYRLGVRRLEPPPPLARIKLSPSLGGVVLSGRF